MKGSVGIGVGTDSGAGDESVPPVRGWVGATINPAVGVPVALGSLVGDPNFGGSFGLEPMVGDVVVPNDGMGIGAIVGDTVDPPVGVGM